MLSLWNVSGSPAFRMALSRGCSSRAKRFPSRSALNPLTAMGTRVSFERVSSTAASQGNTEKRASKRRLCRSFRLSLEVMLLAAVRNASTAPQQAVTLITFVSIVHQPL